MTDIVYRLRAIRERHSYLDWVELLVEAADEIERLRTRLAELEAQRIPDGYVTVRADVLTDAITLLKEDMESMECSHTVRGEWDCATTRDLHRYVGEVVAALAAAPQPAPTTPTGGESDE